MAAFATTETIEGATEPSPTAPSIAVSLSAVLLRLRSQFSELVDKVKGLNPSHPDRPLFHSEAVRIGKRIAETQAILDGRNWVEEQGAKRRGRPKKQG